jgi:hypothetical protein
MALVGANWLLLAAAQTRDERHLAKSGRPRAMWLFTALAIFAAVYAATLAVSFSSRYLSPQNLAFGNAAIQVMRHEWALPPAAWALTLLWGIRAGVGFALPLVALVIIALALVNRGKATAERHAGMLKRALALAASATLAFGMWFWFWGAGGLFGVRYFVPFAAMAAIYGLPLALGALEKMPRRQNLLVQVFCVLPALNLALLLVQREPPDAWQEWSGVNLTAGAPNPLMNQARNFVHQVALAGHSVRLYAIGMGAPDATYQSVADYQRALDPGLPPIIILGSNFGVSGHRDSRVGFRRVRAGERSEAQGAVTREKARRYLR